MKITKVIHDQKRVGLFTEYYINDILFLTIKEYKEYFCTVKNGTPSNIRDRVKSAREIIWHRQGLVLITKNENITVGSRSKSRGFYDRMPNFLNEYPDLNFGHVPSKPSLKTIKELIEQYSL